MGDYSPMDVCWDNIKHFTEDELRCKCGCGKARMDHLFMHKIDEIRENIGEPMVVTSGFRCEDHDKAIGGAGKHPTGKAIDIHIPSQTFLHHMVNEVENGGYDFKGIGLKMSGPYSGRFIHLDEVERDEMEPGVIARWTY